jgi:uncharacterized protein (TIGR03437 family)
MSKFSNSIGRRARLFLVLAGLLSGAILPDRLWSHHAFPQAALQQMTAPGWSRTGSLNTGRRNNTATLLSNGKVLVAGGINCALDYLNSAELFDPTTETWSYTGSLNVPRRGHSATLLPDGKVLVAGGEYGTDQFLDDAELYDPTTGTWSRTGNLTTRRGDHTATLLLNSKVLVVGGGGPSKSAELYDPATGRWSETGSLNNTLYGYHANLLPGGKVLFLGRIDPNKDSVRAELYDPETGRWSVTASLNAIREPYAITRLPNGKVLVTGRGGLNDLRRYAEIYDPTSGTWSSTDASGVGGDNVLLPNGKVLAPGDRSSALYDPVTGRWSVTTGSNLPFIPFNPSQAILLSSGHVLFPGTLFQATRDSICAPTSVMLFDFRLALSGTVSSVSAASYSLTALASEAIASAFGDGLAMTTAVAGALPLPTQLAGTSMRIKDSAGVERLAPLFFVSPTQVNYQIPPGTAAGLATVTITSGDGAVSGGVAIINAVAPGLFTTNADGEGVAAALALRVKADGSQSYEEVAQFDPAQNRYVARPLDLGPEGERVYLVLFGTGIRHRSSQSSVRVWLGFGPVEVSYAGAQGDFIGVDQVNVLVPRSLIGRGEVGITLIVEGQVANIAHVNIK